MTSDQFCLKWNNYQSNIVVALGNLKLDEDFVDVTLACEGRTIKAHRVVLSACSSYFKHIFKVSFFIDHPKRETSFAKVPKIFLCYPKDFLCYPTTAILKLAAGREVKWHSPDVICALMHTAYATLTSLYV